MSALRFKGAASAFKRDLASEIALSLSLQRGHLMRVVMMMMILFREHQEYKMGNGTMYSPGARLNKHLRHREYLPVLSSRGRQEDSPTLS